MKCTSCKQGELNPSFIDGLFRAHSCNSCGGDWILIEDYVTWKERNPQHEFDQQVVCEAEESKKALLCPLTGAIMRKFRLSSKHQHKLDYSASVGGVWLDKGEWQLLKQEGLAGSLNAIFTAPWQKKLRENSAKENFAEIYQEKFGQQDYDKVKDVRNWLESHPNKADLRAYLMASDPYSAER